MATVAKKSYMMVGKKKKSKGDDGVQAGESWCAFFGWCSVLLRIFYASLRFLFFLLFAFAEIPSISLYMIDLVFL